MYEKINITENTLQVLSLFTYDFAREYYVREIERILKISPRTSQLVLEDLENKGILESKIRGKIKLFKLNPNNFTKKYLVFVEQYKAIAFLDKQLLIKHVIEEISPFINGIGLIFGSYVKGLQKKDSDLDIFVIGGYDKTRIDEICKTYNIDVNIKCYPLDIFRKSIQTDILIKEVLKDHVVFLNVEDFIYEVFLNG